MKKIFDTIGVMIASIMYGEIKCRIWVLAVASFILLGIGMLLPCNCKDEPVEIPVTEVAITTTLHEETTCEPTTEKIVVTTSAETTTVETTSQSDGSGISQEDIELIALLTMAEAESEPEQGKRLVIDTVLNRMDSGRWPSTARGVIYQSGQFTSMWNGRVNRCYVSEEYCQLVREEMKSRTNSEVVYFRTDYYSKYGQPMFQVGNHYFSSYS